MPPLPKSAEPAILSHAEKESSMSESTPAVALARAYHFAAVRHVAQRRKGDAAEPYMNHLTEVAELVAEATDGADLPVLIAAVLHDTLEDTDTSYTELARLFGPAVADLVREVTDDKTLPKQRRKDLQIHHAAAASSGAKVIKMADKIANLRSLATSPPADWDAQRIAAYGQWAARVVEHCREANPRLAEQFDAALQDLTGGQ